MDDKQWEYYKKEIESLRHLKHFTCTMNYETKNIESFLEKETGRQFFHDMLKLMTSRFLEDFNPEHKEEYVKKHGLDIEFDQYKNKGYCFTLILKAKEKV